MCRMIWTRCGSRARLTRSAGGSRPSPGTTSDTSATSPHSVCPFLLLSPLSSPSLTCARARVRARRAVVITGEVLAKIYRVSRGASVPSRALREQMHRRLQQWKLDLPEGLDYNLKSGRPCPAPHVLAMHIQYWASVILTHRPLSVVFLSPLVVDGCCGCVLLMLLVFVCVV